MKLLALYLILITASLCAKTIPITIEHAYTHDQLTWGLMQRSSLPENHGMLFHYAKEELVSVWMFNCLKDLSAAFLNRKGEILEIHELKAYPEMMDANRPVHSTKDFAKYSFYEPVFQFYIQRSVKSSKPVAYLLEMDTEWFKKNGIKPGDRLEWNRSTKANIQTRETS